MTPEARLHIELACERQIRRFAALNDAHRHEDMVAMFTVDGSFARPTDPDAVIAGREALLDFFTRRPRRLSCHSMTNTVVDVLSDKQATATSRVLLYLGKDTDQGAVVSDTLIGTFEDEMVKVDGDWLFKARRGSVMMKMG